MDSIITIVLIGGIIGIVGVFGYYIFKTYVMPKRVEELADMIKSGQLAPAIKRLQGLIEENDRDSYTHFLLAEAYLEQNNIQNAIMEYRKVLKLGKFSAKVKETVVRQKLAQLFLKTNNLEDAKKEFIILTKLDGGNSDNYYQVALLFDRAGLSDKALPYFKQTVKLKPNHADAYANIGVIEYNLGNLNEAKIALTEAVKVNANLYNAHYYLGLCLRKQKDYEWAIKEFDHATKDENLRPRAILAKGMCYLDKEQLPQALQEFTKGLECAQKNSDIELNLRYYMAAAAERQRDFHTAIKNWERINDVNKKFKDVSEKLKMYNEFRTDDTIKDFMIATPGKFESTCRQLVEKMDLSVLDIQIINDSEIHVLCTEMEGKWRNTKKSNRVVYIFRTTDPITEKHLRVMHEEMRTYNATRGVCMTTSEFTTQAELFCQSRPIELKAKKEFIESLRAL